MTLTYNSVAISDLRYGKVQLDIAFTDELGRPRRVTFMFPKHRFEDFCYQLGVPVKYGDMAKAARVRDRRRQARERLDAAP